MPGFRSDSLEGLHASLEATFSREHDPDGTHKNIRIFRALERRARTTASTNQEELARITIPGDTMVVRGDTMEVVAFGTMAATATTKQLELEANGVSLFDSTAVTINDRSWRLWTKIIRAEPDLAYVYTTYEYTTPTQGTNRGQAVELATNFGQTIELQLFGTNGTANEGDIEMLAMTATLTCVPPD